MQCTHLATCLSISLLVLVVGGHNALNPAMLLGAVQVAIGSASGFLLNDLVDIQSDRLDKPYRSLAAGVIDTKLATIAFVFLQIVAWTLALSITLINHAGWWLMVYGFTGTSYSLLKRQLSVFKSLYFAVTMLMPMMFAVYVSGRDTANIACAACILLMYVVHREILMDVHDVEGDRAVGAKTIATVVGGRSAVWCAILIWLGSLLVTFYCVDLTGWHVVFAMVYAVSSTVLVCLAFAAYRSNWRSYTLYQWIPLIAAALLLW